MAKNGENARKRQNVDTIQLQYDNAEDKVSRLQAELAKAIDERDQHKKDLAIAKTDALDLHDESTAEIEANIQQIDNINRKVRANLDKDKAEEDAKAIREQYNALTTEINNCKWQLPLSANSSQSVASSSSTSWSKWTRLPCSNSERGWNKKACKLSRHEYRLGMSAQSSSKTATRSKTNNINKSKPSQLGKEDFIANYKR